MLRFIDDITGLEGVSGTSRCNTTLTVSVIGGTWHNQAVRFAMIEREAI